MKCSICALAINVDCITVRAARMGVEYTLNLHWRCFRGTVGLDAERRLMDELIRHAWIQPELPLPVE